MSYGRSQPFFRRFFASRLFLIMAIIFLAIVAFGYARAYYQDFVVRRDIAALQDQVHSLEKKKLESIQILQYVASDAFIEDKARTELNLKKPGEKIVYIENPGAIAQGVTSTQNIPRQNISNPVKWWYYFTRHEIPRE